MTSEFLPASEINELLREHLQLGNEWDSKNEIEVFRFVNSPFQIRYQQSRSGAMAHFVFTGFRCVEMEQILEPLYKTHSFYQYFTSFDFEDKRISPDVQLKEKSHVVTIADDLRPKIRERLKHLENFQSYPWIEKSFRAGEISFRQRRFPSLRRMILKKLANAPDFTEFAEKLIGEEFEESASGDLAIEFKFAPQIYAQLRA